MLNDQSIITLIEEATEDNKTFNEIATSIKEILDSYLNGSTSSFVKNNPAKDLYSKLLKMSDLEGYDHQELAKLSNRLGTIYRRSRNPNQAKEFLELALSLYEEAGNTKKIADIKLNIANYYLTIGQFQEADDRYKDVLNNYQLDSKSLTLAYLNYGNCVYNQGDIEQALKILENAKDLAEKEELSQILPDVYFNLAILYLNRREFPEAQDLFQSAKAGYHAIDKTRGELICIEHLIKLKRNQADTTDIEDLFKEAFEKIPNNDYRFASRIATLALPFVSEEEYLTHVEPYYSELTLSQQEPMEVFSGTFEYARISIKNGKNFETVENLLDSLFEIAKVLDDPEALRAIYMQKLWFSYRSGDIDPVIIELAKRAKDKTVNNQERFELALLSFLANRPKYGKTFLESIADIKKWDNNELIRVNILFMLIKHSLQEDEEEIQDAFNLMVSNRSDEKPFTPVRLLSHLLEIDAENTSHFNLDKSKTYHDDSCLQDHLSNIDLDPSQINCERFPCSIIIEEIFQNI